MCESPKEFKYLPHLSLALLAICFILLCVTISCTEDGLIWADSESCTYYGWGSWYCYDVPMTFGWERLHYSWFSDECDSNGSALGAFSIICLLVIISVIATGGYFRLYKKREDKIFSQFYQRHVLLMICAVLFVVLIATSAAYYAQCSSDLWSVDDVSFYDCGPDYGLIVLWIVCLLLLLLVVLNSGVLLWSEEMKSREADNAPDARQYGHVPTQEQAAAVPQREPVKMTYVQTSSNVATEQIALKQQVKASPPDKTPPPPFNPNVLVIKQSGEAPSGVR